MTSLISIGTQYVTEMIALGAVIHRFLESFSLRFAEHRLTTVSSSPSLSHLLLLHTGVTFSENFLQRQYFLFTASRGGGQRMGQQLMKSCSLTVCRGY